MNTQIRWLVIGFSSMYKSHHQPIVFSFSELEEIQVETVTKTFIYFPSGGRNFWLPS